MRRRAFLKLISAAVIAPSLPVTTPVAARGLTMAMLIEARNKLRNEPQQPLYFYGGNLPDGILKEIKRVNKIQGALRYIQITPLPKGEKNESVIIQGKTLN